MKKKTVEFYPLRLLTLIPIAFLSMKFEDPLVAFLFGVTLGGVTTQIFPLAEAVKGDENETV